MKKLRTLMMIASMVTLSGLFGLRIGAAHGQLQDQPVVQIAAPEWVRPDGTIDLARLPACLEVVDEKGQTVYTDDGEKLCIPSDEVYDSPTLLSAEELAAQDGVVHDGADGSPIVEVPFRLWYQGHLDDR